MGGLVIMKKNKTEIFEALLERARLKAAVWSFKKAAGLAGLAAVLIFFGGMAAEPASAAAAADVLRPASAAAAVSALAAKKRKRSKRSARGRNRQVHIDFDDELHIKGKLLSPSIFTLIQKKNMNYGKLIRLRRNFLPEMRETKEDIQ